MARFKSKKRSVSVGLAVVLAFAWLVMGIGAGAAAWSIYAPSAPACRPLQGVGFAWQQPDGIHLYTVDVCEGNVLRMTPKSLLPEKDEPVMSEPSEGPRVDI